MRYKDLVFHTPHGKVWARLTNIGVGLDTCPYCNFIQCWNLKSVHAPDCTLAVLLKEVPE